LQTQHHFHLADDMRKDDMKYMPKVRSPLRERGMDFRNAFVPQPLYPRL
jgi:hypothetical protein